ncbi:MAG: DUF4349 domain-containing protein [Acutalibacter sp.]|nr:DUF4349 domain-containing protein [Acutalibacter sp.]
MKRYLCLLLALCFCLVSLSGCGSQGKGSQGTSISDAAGSDYGYDYDGAVENTELPGGISADAVVIAADPTRKLIYTAEVSIETEAYETDYSALVQSVKAVGGYVSNEEVRGAVPQHYGDVGRNSYMEARIPTDKFEEFMQTLNEVGRITSRSMNVDDVTDEYYDVEARIEMLEKRYAKFEEHMERATEMSDIIELENEMSQILYELDVLKGSKRHIDNRIEYSTVRIELREVVKAEAVTASEGNLGSRAGDAFLNTLQGMGVFFEDLFVFLVGALPVLIILGVLAVVILFLVRRSAKKRKKNRPANGLPQAPEVIAPQPESAAEKEPEQSETQLPEKKE